MERYRLRASGHFAFLITTGKPVSQSDVLEAVLLADSRQPWKSKHSGDRPAASIHWYSDLKLKPTDAETDRYELEIQPSKVLQPDELQAYYEYVVRLAEIVFSEGLSNVRKVLAWVNYQSQVATFFG